MLARKIPRLTLAAIVPMSLLLLRNCHHQWGWIQLTSKLGLAGNLGQQLCEVWEVVGQELGTEDDVFARV
jgi:hypothetical protein